MIKGLYSAVSAMVMNANRQQILSHNVANMDVPGFKQVMATVSKYIDTQAVNPMSSLNLGENTDELGLLGLGVFSGEDEIDFSQGSLIPTDNDFDLAIQGTAFFHLKTPDGDRYTRDGRFILDEAGNLVTTEGYQVLNSSNQPIKLDAGEFEVTSAGELFVDGKSVGKIGLIEFEDPAADLEHAEGNLYSANGTGKAAVNSSVAQGALENANVNAAQLMAQMIEVNRAYEAAQEMVSNQDELLGKTISSLGRY